MCGLIVGWGVGIVIGLRIGCRNKSCLLDLPAALDRVGISCLGGVARRVRMTPSCTLVTVLCGIHPVRVMDDMERGGGTGINTMTVFVGNGDGANFCSGVGLNSAVVVTPTSVTLNRAMEMIGGGLAPDGLLRLTRAGASLGGELVKIVAPACFMSFGIMTATFVRNDVAGSRDGRTVCLIPKNALRWIVGRLCGPFAKELRQ